MEDIAVTIFRIIIIAMLIVGVASRDKRKRTTAGKDTTGSGDHPSESATVPQPHRNTSPIPAPTAKRLVPSPTPAPAPARTPAPAPAPAPAPVTEPVRRPQPVRNVVVPASAADEPSEPHESGADMQDDILDRFNLRDAVIYSEILRPKFDEQA